MFKTTAIDTLKQDKKCQACWYIILSTMSGSTTANKMFQYNSNHVERYVDPIYFPKAFLREKLDFNIANYYQEH